MRRKDRKQDEEDEEEEDEDEEEEKKVLNELFIYVLTIKYHGEID